MSKEKRTITQHLFFEKRVHYVDRYEPTSRELNQAVQLIRKSRKPLIIIGGGAKYSEAREELVAFSETYRIPMVETQAGKSTVESNHPFNLGGVGVTGTKPANLAAKEADLVIGVGTRYTDFTSSSKTAFSFNNASS